MNEFPAAVARPFHFLIQEQAKCMVAIKELQDQVQSLQDFRTVLAKSLPTMQLRSGVNGERLRPASTTGRILPTIRDGSPATTNGRMFTGSSGSSNDSVEFDGVSSGSHSPKPRRIANGERSGGKRNSSTSSQKFIVVAQGKNWLRIRPYAGTGIDSEVDDSDEPVSTSDSVRSGGDSLRETPHRSHRRGRGERKDSGFSTDPQLTAGESWMSPKGEDELLSLLDVIETQSHELRREVDRLNVHSIDSRECVNPQLEVQNPSAIANCQSDTISRGPMSLSDTGLQQHELLSELECVRKERDQLLERLNASEERAMASHLRVHHLEERLRTAATEREQLDMRIHGMHMQFVRPNGVRKDVLSDGGSSDSGPSSLPDGLLRGRVHVKPNTSRISAVLKETQSLELQRQLLTAIMENEVLKTQLEQITKDWNRRTKEWQREIDVAQHDVHSTRATLDRTRLELQSERARLRMLQRALQSTHVNAPHLNPYLAQSLQALGQSLTDHYKDQATSTEEAETSGPNAGTKSWISSPSSSWQKMYHVTEIPDDTVSSSTDDGSGKDSGTNEIFHDSGGEGQIESYSDQSSDDDNATPVNGTFIKCSDCIEDEYNSRDDLEYARSPFPEVNELSKNPTAIKTNQLPSNAPLTNKPSENQTDFTMCPKTDKKHNPIEIQQRIQNFLQRISQQLVPLDGALDGKEYLETGL